MRWDDHQSFPRGGGRDVCTFLEGKMEREKGGEIKESGCQNGDGDLPIPV